MKIREKRLVETVVDRVCDVCQKSLLIEINNDRFEECAELKAEWGYGSGQDGISYHLDLCENCFNSVITILKDRRETITGTSTDSEFGLDLSRTTKFQE
jgi:hypothetical protein